jgi:hypothetical protein
LKSEAARFNNRKISAAIAPDIHQIKRTRFSAHPTVAGSSRLILSPRRRVRSAWRHVKAEILGSEVDDPF